MVRLTVGYLGTRYAGWAKQAAGKTAGRATVQGLLEGLLGDLLQGPVALTAAGRTDAGVHADAQVVSFATTSAIPAGGIRRALAPRLPADVWLVDAEEATPGFDARWCARRRWYRYAVWRGPTASPGWRGRCLEHPSPLDIGAMRLAASFLPGRRDVAAFATAWGPAERGSRSTVRTVYVADWLASDDCPLLLFEICADGFLRQMVRTIVGTMLWIGQGQWTPDRLQAALAAGDRRAAGPTAPAVGLTLARIEY